MARLGLDPVEGDELPSAFDSDDDDDDDDGVNLEDFRPTQSARGSKPGGGRYGNIGR